MGGDRVAQSLLLTVIEGRLEDRSGRPLQGFRKYLVGGEFFDQQKQGCVPGFGKDCESCFIKSSLIP